MIQVSGVARAANGSIWVLHRGSQAWNADSFSANFTFKGDPIEQDVVVELDSETGSVSPFGMPLYIQRNTLA